MSLWRYLYASRGVNIPISWTVKREKQDQNGQKKTKKQDDAVKYSKRRAATFNDAPLRQKVFSVVATSLIAGVLLGTVEAVMGFKMVPVLLGMLFLLLVLTALGYWLIAKPVDDLHHELVMIERERRPRRAGAKILKRRDEVGQMARTANQLAMHTFRMNVEASSLRRTMDDRVTRSTNRATRDLKLKAMQDPLTGLGNRRFMDEYGRDLMESCLQANMNLHCFVIDLDQFKPVNDLLGHEAGDDLLRFVGKLLKASVRKEDLAIRLGGDEFVLFLPGMNAERVNGLQQRIVKQFNLHVKHKLSGRVPNAGMSIGVSSLWGDDVDDLQTLVKKADGRLYDRKQGGQRRVVTPDSR